MAGAYGDPGKRVLDNRAGLGNAKLLLRGANAVGLGSGIEKRHFRKILPLKPGEGLSGSVFCQLQGIEAKARNTSAQVMCHLRPGHGRATAGKDKAARLCFRQILPHCVVAEQSVALVKCRQWHGERTAACH